jgi:hypothetical protein
MRSWKRHTLVFGILALQLSLMAFAFWLSGCSANEPFDPNSLENQPPVARIFVASSSEGEDLNSTSYFEQSFNWSGTDRDGWVVEYYVSIRTDGDNPAPWITTTTTDTVLTFHPDPQTGEASATLLVACRDNRGAYSDTVTQFIPMRNHPPVVGFLSDYDPHKNMQREVNEGGGEDTYWNWGPNSFRLFAYDLDGFATMDTFYRYTMADGDPEETWDWQDPAADPELGWVQVPFVDGTESREFEVYIPAVAPGMRTVTISVKDEALGDPLFQYTWEVRAPKGQVLYFPDNLSPSVGQPLYRALLDDTYGEGNWDQYVFIDQFPDSPHVLLETMRLFEAVIWTTGSGSTLAVKNASSRNGVLEQYLTPWDDSAPGKLLLISKMVCGEVTNNLGANFVTNWLGINAAASSPVAPIGFFDGYQALSQGGGAYLPDMTGDDDYNNGYGRGMDLLVGTEELYRMEDTTDVPNFCYSNDPRARPPCDPVIGIRRPHRDEALLANVVCFSLQLEYFNHAEVTAALQDILISEMGVTP